MASDLTNLLPFDKARAFRQGYFLRLGTLAVLTLAVLTLAHAALLVPAYLFATERAALAKERLTEFSIGEGSSEEAAMTARIETLSADATRLLAYAKAPAASTLVRGLLAAPRSGISLEGVSFSPPGDGDTEGRMVVRGSATTREALRQYVLSLSALPFVSKADIPLSSYAKETDILFTVTLTGNFES